MVFEKPMEKILMALLLVTFFALMLNLPFGYLRSKEKRLSVMWFVYIHVPIPFVFVLRKYAGLDYRVIPIIVIGAIAGQFLGGRLRKTRK